MLNVWKKAFYNLNIILQEWHLFKNLHFLEHIIFQQEHFSHEWRDAVVTWAFK